MKKKIAQRLREVALSLPPITERQYRSMTGQQLLDEGITVINKGTDLEEEVVATRPMKMHNGQVLDLPTRYKGAVYVPVDHVNRVKEIWKKGGDEAVNRYKMKVQTQWELDIKRQAEQMKAEAKQKLQLNQLNQLVEEGKVITV